MWIYNKLGVALQRSANDQSSPRWAVRTIHRAARRLIVLLRTTATGYHVGMYAGNGMCSVTPRTAAHCALRERRIPTRVVGYPGPSSPADPRYPMRH